MANQEGISGAHTIDKHVGKIDAQLAQRLRDQSGIPGSSSFANLSDAQRFTQQCIEKNEGAIKSYLASGPDRPPSKLFKMVCGTITGTSAKFSSRSGEERGADRRSARRADQSQAGSRPRPSLHYPHLNASISDTVR
ncbi:hypothetical protein H8N01_01385 [Streptomyces sp. AC536]|nr:hypothetical protein [Streptomyces buecherae]QNJ40624.1 hypothetical protein H7H31_12840 [Streptomyces buecherae]